MIKRIFIVGHMGAGKFVFVEEVATLIVESTGSSDQDEEINQIIAADVNKVLQPFGAFFEGLLH